MTKTRPQGTAILTGLALGAAAVTSLVISPLAFAVLIAALLITAAGELFRLIRRLGVSPLTLTGFATVVAFSALAYRGADEMLTSLPAAVAGSVVLSFVVLVLRGGTENALAAVASTVASSIYVGALGGFIVAMPRMEFGFRVTLVFGLMAFCNDVFAYWIGRSFGRHAVSPGVSPGKTWEGIAGGALASFLVAPVAAWQLSPPFTFPRAAVLSALVSVAMPLGDFAESAFKTDAGIKDSGRGFGGHGGVLDRIDGLLFAAPVFFLAYRALVS